jgi:mannose-6-phosphate isomerase-like protein (cupin superfamily)
MPAQSTSVTVFGYSEADPDPHRAKTVVTLCRSEYLKASVQFVREGGENNLHSHPHRDEIFFVLGGRCRVYSTGDEMIADIGLHEGVLIPRGFPYWFESSGAEPLEILLVAAADAPNAPTGSFGGRANHAARVGGRAEEREIAPHHTTSELTREPT